MPIPPLIRRSSPLNYPAGRNPGFDPRHIAGANVRFSCVPIGTLFYQIAGSRIKPGTLVSTAPVTGVKNILGPVQTWSTVGSGAYAQFTSEFASQDQLVTIAAIVEFSSITTTGQSVFVSGSTGGTAGVGLRFQSNSTGTIYLDTFGGPDFTQWTGQGVTTGIPYFVIGSGITVAGGAVTPACNYLLKRLDNGKVRTASFTGSGTIATPTLTYRVGNNQNAGGGVAASIAAVMYSGQFLTTSQMLQWAQDPWAFWYPQEPLNIVLSALQAPQGSLLPQGAGMAYDLSSRQVPPRPDSNQIYFYNPTNMNTGLEPAGAADYERTMHTRGQDRGYGPERNWAFSYNPAQMNTGAKPISPSPGDTREDLSPRQVPFRPDETWTFNYNPTYLNAGAKPAGFSEYTLSPRQVPFRPDETWAFNYNPSQMNTGQIPVGLQIWELSPRQVPFRPEETWVSFYNPTQLQTGLKPFIQTEWPLHNRVPYRSYSWDWFKQISVTNNPFFQTEWPLPIAPPRQLYGVNYNKAQLAGQQPFAQTEWPLSIPRFRPDVTWVWPTPSSFLTTPPKPFAQYDWPLPIQPAIRVYGGFYLRVLGGGAQPFNLYDWPLSTRAPRLDETWVQSYNPTQMQTGQKPAGFQQYDLTVRVFRPDANWVYNPLNFTTTIVFPPGQQIYDIPWRVDPATFKRGVSYSRRFIQAGKPFAQTEWPLSIPRFRPSFNFDPPIGNVFTQPQAFPRNQYDWPLSVPLFRPNFSSQYYYVIESLNPFFQTEWPLPLVAFQFNRSSDFVVTPYLPIVPFPHNQYDWPLSTPKFRIEQTTGFSYNPTQMATGIKPFAQIDWPLSLPDKRGNMSIYTVTAANNPNIYTPPPPSTVKIEWIIRARRRGRR